MPLDLDQIHELYEKKQAGTLTPPKTERTKKFIRLDRQYPRLPEDGNVSRQDSINLHCASRGCRAATVYKYKGAPYCTTHLILLLATENNRLSKLLNVKDIDGYSSSSDTSVVVP